MAKTTNKFTVIRDTREKENHGWQFNKSKYCRGTENSTMATGDYTLVGFEDKFVIERKGSISEWAGNVFQDRFEKELQRLEDIPYSFILLEFNMSDIVNYPMGSGIPKSKWRYLRVTGTSLLRRTLEFMVQYNTKIILCGNKGKDTALSLFKRIYQNLNK